MPSQPGTRAQPTPRPTPIRELGAPDADTIRREVFASYQPAVLRGLVRGWPAVALGRRSAPAVVDYLRRLDNGTPVDAIMTPPEAAGRIFYEEGMHGFNFVRNRLSISTVAEQVLRYGAFPRPPAVAVQSALIRDCLPGFTSDNVLEVLGAAVEPRIWLGNAITTPTHLDEWHNVGCVVSGRRRFTLFPPEQIGNLYIGPIDFAPTGAPMSLVRLHAPDFERFPKFREALAAAHLAELEPGDAIYIPPLWWHHVESLEPFNLLVNYWWHVLGGAAVGSASGFDGLLLSIANLRSLPPPARAAWRALFEHYVFGEPGEVTAHIPPHRHGLLGTLTPADAARLREQIAQRLKTQK
jgi:Cupin-like domain